MLAFGRVMIVIQVIPTHLSHMRTTMHAWPMLELTTFQVLGP